MSATPNLDELNRALAARGLHVSPTKVACALFTVINSPANQGRLEFRPWFEKLAQEVFDQAPAIRTEGRPNHADNRKATSGLRGL